MPSTIIGSYSIRDHSAPHIAPVPIFLNSKATRSMADGMTEWAELLYGAHRNDPALACIRRAYAYLQTSQRLARAAQRTTDGDMTRIRDEYLGDVDTALTKLAEITRTLGATYPPDNTANLIDPAHQHYHNWLEAHMPAQMMVNLTNRMFQPDDQPIETLDWETRSSAIGIMHQLHQEVMGHITFHGAQPATYPSITEHSAQCTQTHQTSIHLMDNAQAMIETEADNNHQSIRQHQSIATERQTAILEALNHQPLIPGTMRSIIAHPESPDGPDAAYMVHHHSIIMIGRVTEQPYPELEQHVVTNALRNVLVHMVLDLKEHHIPPHHYPFQAIRTALSKTQQRRAKTSDKLERQLQKRVQLALRILSTHKTVADQLPPAITHGFEPTQHLTPIE